MRGSYYFDDRHERGHIERTMAQHQKEWGTTVLWFRFAGDEEESSHTVYGESYPGGGNEWDDGFPVPVIDAVPFEGREQNENGFFTIDRIHIKASAEQLRRAGLDDLERGRDVLRDRIVYRGVVYDVMSIQSLGRVNGRDVTVGIDGDEVTPDELVNTDTFAEYAD